MNKLTLLVLTLVVVTLSGCSNSTTDKNKAAFELPKPGTVIDSLGVKIIEDKLNDSHFSVVVLADSNVKGGIYDVRATYGFDIAEGSFTMPNGLESYKLVLKKGDAPYTFVIGFKVPKDTTFYEYFEVSGKKNSIGMQYLKAYIFK